MKSDNMKMADQVAEYSISNQYACAKILVDHPECLANCRFDAMDAGMRKRLLDFMVNLSNEDNNMHITNSCLGADYDLGANLNSVLDSWLNVIRSNPNLSSAIDWSQLEACRYEE